MRRFNRTRQSPLREGSPGILRLGVLLGAALAIGGCVYDGKNRCGDTQVYDGTFCVCPAGKVATGVDQCVACGANEQVTSGICQCVSGFMRAAPGMPCAAAAGLGISCQVGGAACPNAPFTHCQPTAGGAGYCTQSGCTTDAECPGGWTCRKGEPAHCARPPVGLGRACASAADCAGSDATHCETVQLKACLVEGCTPSPNSCSPGYLCCDLTARNLAKTLCLPTTACP